MVYRLGGYETHLIIDGMNLYTRCAMTSIKTSSSFQEALDNLHQELKRQIFVIQKIIEIRSLLPLSKQNEPFCSQKSFQ